MEQFFLPEFPNKARVLNLTLSPFSCQKIFSGCIFLQSSDLPDSKNGIIKTTDHCHESNIKNSRIESGF